VVRVQRYKIIFKTAPMRIIELMKISSDTLYLLSENDIKMSDVKYLDMYSEYEKMMAKSLKVTYIVEHLSDKYNVSVAQVYRIIKRLKRTIKV
jgi:Mor family transcriptional regulator